MSFSLRPLLLCMVGLLIVSCRPDFTVATIVEFPEGTDPAAEQFTLSQLLERLEADFGPGVIHSVVDGNHRFLTTHGGDPLAAMGKLTPYFGSSRLEILPTVSADDPWVAAVLDSVDLARFGAERPAPGSGRATVATVSDDDASALLDALHRARRPDAEVRFAVLPSRDGQTEVPAQIIGLDPSPNGLSNADVASAVVQPDPQMGDLMVMIDMTDAGTRRWAQMTTAAFERGQQQVAILVDGEVWSAPAVNSPITGGQAALTGNFKLPRAEALALQVGWEPLKVPVRVVSRTLVE